MQFIFSRTQYIFLFALLAVVYIIGLFVPLMDNDSAHHAVIALRMHLTGDYVNLIDGGRDYLDKPHLHFWLAAWSYKIFGVTGFAYKLPSFLFTILGTYSSYRLGRSLYNSEVGRLSALMVASAFAYILANNDVRMDAILTASVALATWQLVDWVNSKRLLNALGAAVGLALGFCTKGHIAVFVPAVGTLAYILYKKDWRSLYHWHLLAIMAAFALLIAPVVYCYYLQYDLHPEKVIRGKSGRSGVAFILWQQNFERLQGDSWGGDGRNDYLFFFHSLLWAFAPWSLLAFIAFFKRISSVINRKYEWLTLSTFAVMAVLMTFSGFKLPHYLNIIFPATAVLTAAHLVLQWSEKKTIKPLLIMQVVICSICLLAAGVLNAWAFPVNTVLTVLGFFVLIGITVLLLRSTKTILQKLLGASVLTSTLVFFLLNANFYPKLLTYQAGNELAKTSVAIANPKDVFFWPAVQSHSYNFYAAELRKEYADSVLANHKPVWIAIDNERLSQLQERRLPALETITQRDYEITQLQLPFINPATRNNALDTLYLIRVK